MEHEIILARFKRGPKSPPYRYIKYATRTTNNLTRFDLEAAQNITIGLNHILFVAAVMSLVAIGGAYTSDSYPFVDNYEHEGKQFYAFYICLLMYHIVVHYIGLTAHVRENLHAIYLYCGLVSSHIIIDLTSIIYFRHYADDDLKEYAKDEQFLLFVVITAILLNTGLVYLSLIVSAQLREHQFVNRKDVGDLEASKSSPEVKITNYAMTKSLSLSSN